MNTNGTLGGFLYHLFSVIYTSFSLLYVFSSSLRSGTKGCGKLFIGYNFAIDLIDDGAESKFGTHKELIVLNIWKYKYYIMLISHMTCPLTILLKILNC